MVWSLQDISWQSFQQTLVDPDILKVIKTASLVEYNAHDYGQYLRNLFHEDPEFYHAIEPWVEDEVKHGLALGRWVKCADPEFDLEGATKRFHTVFRIPLHATQSIRGSNAGELMARCIVETGTSSFYTVLAEACAEPVLKEICQKIAADEFRHYRLFYTHLQRYLEKDKLSRLSRLRIALKRIRESENDELAGAYYAANIPETQPYHHKMYSHQYLSRVYRLYRPQHIHRIIRMVCKAAGISPQGFWIEPVGSLYFYMVFQRYRRPSACL